MDLDNESNVSSWTNEKVLENVRTSIAWIMGMGFNYSFQIFNHSFLEFPNLEFDTHIYIYIYRHANSKYISGF